MVNMKRFIIISLLILFSFQVASSKIIKELNTTIDIKNNGKTDMELVFTFSNDIKEIHFSMPYEIHDLKVDGGNCYIEKFIDNVLVCKPRSPFIVGQIIIKVNFTAEGMTATKENRTFFSLDISMLHDVDRVNIVVKIPEMMVLINDDLLPISPSSGDMVSDGRRIIIKWKLRDQFTGDIIPLRIYYENTKPSNILQFISYKWIILLLLIIAVGIFFVYEKLSKKSSIVLSVLNEAERIVVDIIQKKGNKDVDQRVIVSDSGFSKAKISRILQSLEARGVISIRRSGRKNRVDLKKRFVEEKTEQ